MANSAIHFSEFHPSRRALTVGAALTGAGTLLTAVGATVVVVALATAGRSWLNSWDTPPSELAARQFRRAQMAAQAGRSAWLSDLN
jgi:membrane protein implicated in regulation of membrane protease activity